MTTKRHCMTTGGPTLSSDVVPGVATDAAPSWTAHAGESVWLAWRGTGSNTSVFVAGTSTFQPAQGSGLYSFGPQHKVDGASATGSPAIASLEGTLYLFWTNAADGQIWWANSSDGETWAGVQALVLGGNEIPASSLSPAVVSGNGSLYLAWKGANTDTRIWLRRSPARRGRTRSPSPLRREGRPQPAAPSASRSRVRRSTWPGPAPNDPASGGRRAPTAHGLLRRRSSPVPPQGPRSWSMETACCGWRGACGRRGYLFPAPSASRPSEPMGPGAGRHPAGASPRR